MALRNTARRIAIGFVVLAAGAAGLAYGARHPDVWQRLVGARERGERPHDPDRLWTCGMHPQVLQDEPGNCPICGMELTPIDAGQGGGGSASEGPSASPAASGKAAKDRRVAYWWDPMMSPPYIAEKPGKSPMGMDLVPVYEDEVAGGAGVTIDPVVMQNMGLRTAVVTEGSFSKPVRTVGYLRASEKLTYDVTVKFSGWVERLHADVEGTTVEKGAPLFDVYSPDLVVAQSELQAARRAHGRLPANADPRLRRESEQMVETAKRKLGFWDLTEAQIEELAAQETPQRTITFRSPIRGVLLEKSIVQGSSLEPGRTVLKVADLSTLWMDAKVGEMDLPQVEVGQAIRASFRGAADREVRGTVVFVDPRVDPATRKGTARLSLENPDGTLKPGTYATVEISPASVDRAVLVPLEAVIDTGTRQIAFVARDAGRFDPRDVTTGRHTGDGRLEILRGLAPGETVVVSGQFLLEAESRTQEAIQKMLDARRAPPASPAPSHEGHEPPATVPPAEGTPAAPEGIAGVVKSYLDVWRALASDDAGGAEAAAAALAKSAGAYGSKSDEAEGFRKAVSALQVADIAARRKAFVEVGEAFVRLVDADPHGSHAAHGLVVVNCTMFPGTWVQPEGEVENPYYGEQMRRCGTVERTLAAADPR